nr:transposase (putative), gypsy type [Tanacetum cinerariifolium]
MGWDTIQLENAVSIISQEYLLEFTSEYGKNTPQCYTKPLDSLKNWKNQFFWVDEKAFPTIVDWHTNASKDEMPSAYFYLAVAVATLNTRHLFNLISALNPTKVKTGTRPCAAYEVPLLTATASRVIDMGDTAMASGSSGTPAAIKKSPLDFVDEDPPPLITERGDKATAKAILESGPEKEAAVMGPVVNKRRRKRGNEGAKANVPPKVLRKDHVSSRPSQSTLRGKSSRITLVAKDPDSEKSTSFTSMVGSPGICGMDARLDTLSIDFNEELYPHMLTAIAGRRWVIEHGLGLAVMKCAASTKLRQVFADVVSDRIAKGMSEGLKHGVEHGKAKVDLATIKAYDHEADTKYVAVLHELKDLKYPLVDQLEKLKDAPIDVIMVSLLLESDSGEDAPQGICELCPSSSQLKILVYPGVRNPKDTWSFKEDILLEDVITANISRAEKKKKCRVVCHTHGVGSSYHARSDGVPVSVHTVSPQGLAILLADAATQTDRTEDEASSRLLRSKFVPPMYNLDWP